MGDPINCWHVQNNIMAAFRVNKFQSMTVAKRRHDYIP